VREQVGLYGTLTGSPPSPAKQEAEPNAQRDSQRGAQPARATGGTEEKPPLADVVAFPRRDKQGSARRRQDR
jgi:hypothetical protein